MKLSFLSQLAGNFVRNTRKPAVIIHSGDVRVAMSADPVSKVVIEYILLIIIVFLLLSRILL